MKTNRMKTIMLMLAFIMITCANGYAQLITVKGRVIDATNRTPIVGCAVVVKETHNGVITKGEGRFSLHVKQGATLVFSSIGYAKQTVKVEEAKEELIVAMKSEQIALCEEMVVRHGALKSQMVGRPIRGKSKVISMAFIPPVMENANTETYQSGPENRFKPVADEPLSTFSIDVDVASYSNMRRFINQGKLPPAESIRTEELINYFSYDYGKPTGSDPVKLTAEVGACPWNNQDRLVRIGIKAREIADEKLPASNLTFLIDVSGSMYGPTRLELVKSSLKLLVNNLREKDRVAIVVYAGSAGEVLSSTSGSDKQKIREALDKLTSGGSTAGGEGIQLAYKIAKNNFITGGNNRIILCTDGDFNVGISSDQGMESLIEKERKAGVFLTVLGYGMGNYKDSKMQVLAQKGNGNHAYIDNLQEANKVLVNEFGGTLFTVAKDVKLQIEFNPAEVQAYRLIGYESRLLNKEDFNDDTKDAGEMGAGHTVTALYEVVPVGIESNFVGKVDDLKYQKTPKFSPRPFLGASKELLTIKLRYKQPDGDVSRKMELQVMEIKGVRQSSDFRFAAAVAMFGQLLRNSDFKGDATYDRVIELAKTALDNDEQGYRREFVRLVQGAKGLYREYLPVNLHQI